jgi:hypothetical protein
MFQLTKEPWESGTSAPSWNILTFQTTNEGRFERSFRPLSLRLEHVMFQGRIPDAGRRDLRASSMSEEVHLDPR